MEETPIKREKLQCLALEILGFSNELSAREIAVILKNQYGILNGMRQDIQPRLTELEKVGRVMVSGTKLDEVTRKRVSVYRRISE